MIPSARVGYLAAVTVLPAFSNGRNTTEPLELDDIIAIHGPAFVSGLARSPLVVSVKDDLANRP